MCIERAVPLTIFSLIQEGYAERAAMTLTLPLTDFAAFIELHSSPSCHSSPTETPELRMLARRVRDSSCGKNRLRKGCRTGQGDVKRQQHPKSRTNRYHRHVDYVPMAVINRPAQHMPIFPLQFPILPQTSDPCHQDRASPIPYFPPAASFAPLRPILLIPAEMVSCVLLPCSFSSRLILSAAAEMPINAAKSGSATLEMR
jgi:hypothetical protein